MSITLCLATTNNGKIKEISETICRSIPGINLVSLKEFDIPEPDEPYHTFLENAVHKARHYGEKTNCLTLADDSGLCVNALDQFPGVYTKEFMFESVTPAKALIALNEKLKHTFDRSAVFYSAIAVYDPQNNSMFHYQDTHEGLIAHELRGVIRTEMFFDTMFIPKGYAQTLGELPLDIKNTIGHRAKAIQEIAKQLKEKYI